MWKSEGRARARKGERKNTGYTSIISTEWNQNAGYLIWCCVNSHYRHLCSYDHWLWLFVFFSGAALYLRFFPHLPSEGCSILLELLLFLLLLPLFLLANPLPRQASLPSVSPILFASSWSHCAPLDLIPQGLCAVCRLDLIRTDSGPRVLRWACILTASCRTVVDLFGPIPDRECWV